MPGGPARNRIPPDLAKGLFCRTPVSQDAIVSSVCSRGASGRSISSARSPPIGPAAAAGKDRMGMEPNRSSLPFARVNPKSRLGQMWAHLLLSS